VFTVYISDKDVAVSSSAEQLPRSCWTSLGAVWRPCAS